MLSLQSRARGDKPDHFWTLTMHVDGCHFYTSTYYCPDCGGILKFSGERDVDGDPWSMIWMIDESGEQRCPRCEELLDGAAPIFHREQTRP